MQIAKEANHANARIYIFAVVIQCDFYAVDFYMHEFSATKNMFGF